MEKIRMEYETGWMELDVDMFFPCLLEKARKVFPLINQYAADEDKEELLAALWEMEKGYKARCEMCKTKSESYYWNQREQRHWLAELRSTKTLLKRVQKNIGIFTNPKYGWKN